MVQLTSGSAFGKLSHHLIGYGQIAWETIRPDTVE